MKFKFIFGLLLFVIYGAQAQDKIITLQNDTIYCRIITITNGKIYYEQPAVNGGVVGSSLAIDQSTTYFRVAPEIAYGKQLQERGTQPEKRWRFGFQGGPSYMLASTTDAENEFVQMGTSAETAEKFYKNLNWGYHFDTDIHFMVRESWGLGIRYSLFSTAAKTPITIRTYDAINYWYLDMEERIYVNYIGLSFFLQEKWLNQSHKLRLNQSVSFGYVSYRDEVEFQRNSFIPLRNGLATGNSVGGNIDVSLEYFPVSWLSIAVNTGYFASWIWKMKMSDGYSKQTVKLKDVDMDNENISRLDFSIGLRFYVK